MFAFFVGHGDLGPFDGLAREGICWTDHNVFAAEAQRLANSLHLD